MGQAGVIWRDRPVDDLHEQGSGSKNGARRQCSGGWLSGFCQLFDLSKTMKLAFKITLLLFAVIVLFITIISFYFYSQLNQDFERRSSELMSQSLSSIDNQLKMMNETLQNEMSRSSSTIFSEN